MAGHCRHAGKVYKFSCCRMEIGRLDMGVNDSNVIVGAYTTHKGVLLGFPSDLLKGSLEKLFDRKGREEGQKTLCCIRGLAAFLRG